jgi:hypothetical protein
MRCNCRAHTAAVVNVDPEAGFVPVQELPEKRAPVFPAEPLLAIGLGQERSRPDEIFQTSS